jgi:hypothetical protein
MKSRAFSGKMLGAGRAGVGAPPPDERGTPMGDELRLLRQKVESLADDAGDVRTQLLSCLDAAVQRPASALALARGVGETLAEQTLAAIGIKPPSMLDACLRELERQEVMSRGLVPAEIITMLHKVRTIGNKATHDALKIAVTADDVTSVLGDVLRVTRWYYCEFARGPRLKPDAVFRPVPAAALPRCPAVPRDLADRRNLVRTIEERLKQYGVSVLVGPHGMGKTVLAAGVFTNAGHGQWIECDDWDAGQPLPSGGLTVFDDVSADQDLLTGHALRSFSGQALVTTRDEQVARAVLSDLGKANCPEAVVRVAGFERDEGTRFLDKIVGDQLSAGEKAELVGRLFGCPLALQAIPELIAGHGPSPALKDLLSAGGALSADTVAEQVLCEWVIGAVRGDARVATRALCRISYVGMSPHALAHVVGTSVEKLTRQLSGLLEKGYVRRSCHVGDELWIPHDVLRGHFRSLSDDPVDRRHDLRYVGYLARAVQEGRVADLGLCTRIDAWIVAIRSAFAELHASDLSRGAGDQFAPRANAWGREALEAPRWENARDRFLTRLRVNGRVLNALVGSSLPPAQGKRLVSVLQERFTTAECAEVIPAAQCLALLPSSEPVARTAWLGATHPDGWARACSIWAAVHHWLGLGTQERREGVKLLKEWLQQPDVLLSQDGGVADLDLAAALGGLCALGELEWAAEFVMSQSFAESCPRSTLSVLTVVVGLLDRGMIELARVVFQDAGWRTLESDAKQLVYRYAAEKGVHLSPAMGLGTFNMPQAATVAAAAHSDGFARLAAQHDKQSFSLISPDTNERREFQAADLSKVRRGRRLFLGVVAALVVTTAASIGLGLWRNPDRIIWFSWVVVPLAFLAAAWRLWHGKWGEVWNVLGRRLAGWGLVGIGAAGTFTACRGLIVVGRLRSEADPDRWTKAMLALTANGLQSGAFLIAGLLLLFSISLRGFLLHRREMALLDETGWADGGGDR